jgi:hypothetical protein
MSTFRIAEQLLPAVGLAVEGICVLSFVVSRTFRRLPFVFSFLVYLFVTDAILIRLAHISDNWLALVVTTYIGYLVEAAAVWELAYQLLRNSGSGATSIKWRIAALCCVLSALGAYLLTNLQSYSNFGFDEQRYLHVDLTVSILRVLIFIAILMFLRLESSGPNAVTTRVVLAFAAYAVCIMLWHVLNELAPALNLPPITFEFSECVCSYVWVLLLFILTWQILRPITASVKLSEL